MAEVTWGGCSEGPFKEGPHRGILTKQRTNIMATLGTGFLNNYHMKPEHGLFVGNILSKWGLYRGSMIDWRRVNTWEWASFRSKSRARKATLLNAERQIFLNLACQTCIMHLTRNHSDHKRPARKKRGSLLGRLNPKP